MKAEIEKWFKENYSKLKTINFRVRAKELGLSARNYYFNTRDYVVVHTLGRLPAAFEYVFRRGKLPPEAEHEIKKLNTDLRNADERYKRGIEAITLAKQREISELMSAQKNEISKLLSAYERKVDELTDNCDFMISTKESKLKGLESKLSGLETENQNLRSLTYKLATGILDREADKYGTEGHRFPYFHLILKREPNGEIHFHDLNRPAISALAGYSQSNFVKANKKTFDGAFEELGKEELKKVPSKEAEVEVSVGGKNKIKLVLKRIFPERMSFLAKMPNLPNYYRLYEKH